MEAMSATSDTDDNQVFRKDVQNFISRMKRRRLEKEECLTPEPSDNSKQAQDDKADFELVTSLTSSALSHFVGLNKLSYALYHCCTRFSVHLRIKGFALADGPITCKNRSNL